MEIQDLAGISKPLKKLIETCLEGIGAVARPWILKRNARALAEANNLLSDAGLQIDSGRLDSLEVQISKRVAYREARRIQSLYEVVNHAGEALPPIVNEEPVDSEWTSRFFNSAQDVSNDDLRKIWGSLLAGEVSAPGSCSIRTLDVLRNLAPKEAGSFNELCKLSFASGRYFAPPEVQLPINQDPGHVVLGKDERLSKIYQNANLDLGAFDDLCDAGLITSFLEQTLHIRHAQKGVVLLEGKGQAFVFAERMPTDQPWALDFPMSVFSKAGQELQAVLQPDTFPSVLIDAITELAENMNLRLSIAEVSEEQGRRCWRWDTGFL